MEYLLEGLLDQIQTALVHFSDEVGQKVSEINIFAEVGVVMTIQLRRLSTRQEDACFTQDSLECVEVYLGVVVTIVDDEGTSEIANTLSGRWS